MADIIYGSELSSELKEEMKKEIEAHINKGLRAPRLAVILVGNNPASLSYIKGKEKACAEVGIATETIHLEETTTQEELNSLIKELSNKDDVDGILLQLPLPKGLKEDEAIACISPDKDVDGLTPINVGKLFLGESDGFSPCTPLGVMELLKKMNCEIEGKRAVVIGRSKLVGTPVARLLQNENATVTIAHSRTKDLPGLCKEADILVAAIGRSKMIDESYVKEGAYVIDVGINRGEDEKLYGDVDFDSVSKVAKAITPVPKGVGPMTICMLLKNTLLSYKRRNNL